MRHPLFRFESVWFAGLVPLLALTASAATVNVKYQVDLSVQVALGNFDPNAGDTAVVSGNWDGWSLTNGLSVTANPSIYELTLSQTVGSWPNYQFVIVRGSKQIWETSAGNRWFQVPAVDTNLPAVYFNNMNGFATNAVTFQVDMAVQSELGAFTVGAGFVTVAADALNNWDSGSYLLTNAPGTSNYLGTFDVVGTVGNNVSYKFVMNNTWEADGLGPNGAKNRQFVFPNSATNLPPVFFNNVSNLASIVTNPVTFQVNLAAQTALGRFTPGVDSVTVASSVFNNWLDTTTYALTNSPANTNLYSNTFDVPAVPGATVSYKFTMNGGIAWETAIFDRTFAARTNTLLTLPAVFFDDVGNLGPLQISPVTAGQVTLSWSSGTNVNSRIRLQSTTNLSSGVWQDIPGTTGISATNISAGSESAVFRLIGP